MSKEEILSSWSLTGHEPYDRPVEMELDSIYQAMEEYAKQQAIEFLLDFVGKLSIPKDIKEIKEGSIEYTLIHLPSTIENRYDLFINQTEQKQ